MLERCTTLLHAKNLLNSWGLAPLSKTLPIALMTAGSHNGLGLIERRNSPDVFIVVGQESKNQYQTSSKFESSSSYIPLPNMLDGRVAIASMTQAGAVSFGNEQFVNYTIFKVNVSGLPVVSVKENWSENRVNLEQHIASNGTGDAGACLASALRYDEAHVDGNITTDRMTLLERRTATRQDVATGTIQPPPNSNPA